MGFQNICMSPLVILPASVFEISCGKQTDRQTAVKTVPLPLPSAWVIRRIDVLVFYTREWRRLRVQEIDKASAEGEQCRQTENAHTPLMTGMN